MADELKQELQRELSVLVRDFEERGMDPDEIEDSLSLYSDVARSRERC